MVLKPVGILRFLLALVCLQLASACGDDSNPPTNPPPKEDTTAPTTAATPAGGSFNAPVTVTLSCSDPGGSGCEATYYTNDGSTPSKSSPRYSAPINVAATTTLKFFSVDKSGNEEAVKTESYTFDSADTTPPTVSASPAGGTYTAAQTVTLTCDDGAGTGCQAIRYTTDGSTPTASSTAYSAPLTVSANTTLKFFATDAANNASEVVTETYVIDTGTTDTTPPTVAANPAGGTFNAAQSVTLTCDDGSGSGCASIRYTTDGSTPTASSTAYTAALSLTANTTLKFLGVDNAGNVSAVQTETYVIIIDTTEPTVTASPAGGTYNAAQTVTLTCDDGSGSGCASIHYTTDGSTPTVGSPAYTAALSLTANTTLKFLAVDNAGIASAVQTEVYVIDTTPPTVSASPASGTFSTAQTVSLSCTDGSGSGCASIHYTTDGSAPTAASQQYTEALTLSATTTLKFLAVDNAGNTSAVQTEEYTIVLDTTAPTVAASPAGGTYNTDQSVTLTCDDGSGSGCASIRYTTDGSTPTESSPAYTAALSLTANTTLKFLGVDNAGNVSAVQTETYVIDTTPPTVSALPQGGTFGAPRNVTLSCEDGSGTGCASIHYTTDGSTPTTSSTAYTTQLTISVSTTLKFIGVDIAGNVSNVRTEDYVIDTTPATTTAEPPGGLYATEQTVLLSCTHTGVGECDLTYYTVDGTTPDTSSPQYTGPITISSNTTLKFFSTDSYGNAEPVKTEAYFIGSTPADTSAQIAAVRAADNGAINQPIDLALVTYIKPLVGADGAGFFLQAEQSGPAVFIAVDPATLLPVPFAGDRVSLVATQKATVNGAVHVTAISDFSVEARDQAVEPLRTDVSTVDLVSELGNYESELISITGTVRTAFSSSGAAHVSASLATVAVPSNNSLQLRLPTTVQEQLDVETGCTLTARAPLWRFNANAQPSAWRAEDLIINSCPPPEVLSAVAISPTSLVVRFSRHIDPASVLPDGSQFTFDNGLSASFATVSDREVTLTTVAQTGGQSYTVTVDASVQDTRGTPLHPTNNHATFTGYQAPAQLLISELNPNIGSSRDLLELYVVQGGSLANMSLVMDSSTTLLNMPSVQVVTGDVIVVHFTPNATNSANETTSKDQFPQATYSSNYDTAWDFVGSSNIGYSSRVFRVKDAQGNTLDGASFSRTGVTQPGQFSTHLQALQAEGQWLPSDCGGALCTPTSTPTAFEVSANWASTGSTPTGTSSDTVSRVSTTDTNTASDWSVGAHSWGLPNP